MKTLSSAYKIIKKYFSLILAVVVLCTLMILDRVSSDGSLGIISSIKYITSSFTPTSDIFDEENNISFVSYILGFWYLDSNSKVEDTVFCTPTINEPINKTDEYLEYNFAGLIYATAEGVVSAVGFNQDGVKYIKISHANGYDSIYEGINFLGVAAGEKVKQGSAIASVSTLLNLKFYVTQNGNIVKREHIKWQE